MVFKKGKSKRVDFLASKALKNNLSESRFGFVVSKKISNKATVRNKVKRRLRKAVSNKLKRVTTSKDVVIIALPGIEKKLFSDIEEAMGLIINSLETI